MERKDRYIILHEIWLKFVNTPSVGLFTKITHSYQLNFIKKLLLYTVNFDLTAYFKLEKLHIFPELKNLRSKLTCQSLVKFMYMYMFWLFQIKQSVYYYFSFLKEIEQNGFRVPILTFWDLLHDHIGKFDKYRFFTLLIFFTFLKIKSVTKW